MADKNSNDFRNGRRSRGASPHSEENSDGSDSDQGRRNRSPYFSPNTISLCTEQYFSDAFCVCSCLYLRIHNAVNNDWVLRYVFSDNGMRIGEEFQAEIPSYNPGRLLPLFLCYWICFSFCIFSSFLSIYYFILFYCFYLFVLFWFWLFQMVDYGKMLSVWTEQLNLAKNMP